MTIAGLQQMIYWFTRTEKFLAYQRKQYDILLNNTLPDECEKTLIISIVVEKWYQK